jgi:hypothetical protein
VNHFSIPLGLALRELNGSAVAPTLAVLSRARVPSILPGCTESGNTIMLGKAFGRVVSRLSGTRP